MIEIILVYSLVLLTILFTAGVLSPKFEKWVQNFLDNENDFRKREIEKIKRIIKKVLARKKKKDIVVESGQYVLVGDYWVYTQNKEPIEEEEPRWTDYELELISEIDDAYSKYLGKIPPAPLSEGGINKNELKSIIENEKFMINMATGAVGLHILQKKHGR